jgi:hypothetical protein
MILMMIQTVKKKEKKYLKNLPLCKYFHHFHLLFFIVILHAL